MKVLDLLQREFKLGKYEVSALGLLGAPFLLPVAPLWLLFHWLSSRNGQRTSLGEAMAITVWSVLITYALIIGGAMYALN